MYVYIYITCHSSVAYSFCVKVSTEHCSGLYLGLESMLGDASGSTYQVSRCPRQRWSFLISVRSLPTISHGSWWSFEMILWFLQAKYLDMLTPRNQGHLIDPCPTPKQHSANSPRSGAGNALKYSQCRPPQPHECSRSFSRGNFFIMHSLVFFNALETSVEQIRSNSFQDFSDFLREENSIESGSWNAHLQKSRPASKSMEGRLSTSDLRVSAGTSPPKNEQLTSAKTLKQPLIGKKVGLLEESFSFGVPTSF